MVDVVLIHSPLILYESIEEKRRYKEHGGDERSYYPMGILYLTSYLEKRGHSVRVIDVAVEDKILDDIVDIIDEEKPYVVGISSTTHAIQSAVNIAKRLKEVFGNDFLLGIGGVHICCDITFIERFPCFDFCVINEGEKSLEEIVRKAKGGTRTNGIVFGEPTFDLNSLPFPARHHIDPKIYLREERKKEIPAAGMLGSRGCPYQCSFCCIPTIGHKVRLRSAINIVNEMESIFDQCEGSYSFVDDCMTLNRNHILEFCQEIIDRRLKVRWIASTRPSGLDEEVVKAMKRSGCTDLYFGVESGSERIRNQIVKKNIRDSEIIAATTLCRKHKIVSNFFLMVGFPTERWYEMIETAKVGNRLGADMVGIHLTTPQPNTELFRDAVKRNIIPYDIVDKFASGSLGKGFRGVWPFYVPEGFALQDLVTIKKLTYRKFYLNPLWFWRRLKVYSWGLGKFRDDLALIKIGIKALTTGGTKGQLA